MKTNEEYKGYWFLPDKKENRIPGILYFETNNKIRLELIGGFETDIKEIFNSKTTEVILGITGKNEKISLLVCHSYSSVTFPSEFQTTNYTCQYFIKGKHLSSINELTFNKVRADLTSLYDWHPSDMIRNTIEFSKEEKPFKTIVSIDENDSWEKTVSIDSEYTLRIFGIGNFNGSYDNSTYDFSQNTILEIEHNNAKTSFAEFLNKIEIFRQFLSLATLSPINYTEITLFDNSDFQELKDGKRILKPIILSFIERENASKKNDSFRFLFTHKDIEPVFPDIITKWYNSKENLAPIRNHLIASIKPRIIFTSLDFLIIIQSIEGYHRRFIKKKIKVPKGESELNLRLKEIIKLFDGIDKIKRSPINLVQVVSSRNYYSHFYEKDENVLQGKELYFLTQQLRNLLICCVLYLIGFEVDLINKLLNKNDKI